MVGCGRGRGGGGGGNHIQQTKLTEMRHIVNDLLRVVQAFQWWELAGTHMEILEGNCYHLDIQEGVFKDENDYIKDETSFHDVGPIEHTAQVWHEVVAFLHNTNK